MPTRYTVVPGDCLSSIAHRHGFANYRTIYDAPENANFRRLRPNPNLIYPGDELFIPDKEPSPVSLPVGVLNTIIVEISRPTLRLMLVDGSRRPLGDVPYTLDVAGQHLTGTTRAGLLEHPIPPLAVNAHLLVYANPKDPAAAVEYELLIGHLDPIGTVRGVQGRLQNLGLYAGPISGSLDATTRAAWAQFCC